MLGYFNLDKLKELLKDFYTVVGIRLSVFDADFNVVLEYPTVHPDFCKIIRSTNEGLNGCKKCDNDACIRALKYKKYHIYTCHMGLTEAIFPIEIDSKIIGFNFPRDSVMKNAFIDMEGVLNLNDFRNKITTEFKVYEIYESKI